MTATNDRPRRNGRHRGTAADPHALSAGRVAALLGVAVRTACHLIDSGELPGWRVPTRRGPGDRRVARADLEAFARRHGIPLGGGGAARRAEVLLVGLAEEVVAGMLARPECREGLWGVTAAATAFEAGVRCARDGYALVIAGSPGLSVADVRALAAGLASTPALSGTRLVAVLPEDGCREGVAGACLTLAGPVTAGAVGAAVARALGGGE